MNAHRTAARVALSLATTALLGAALAGCCGGAASTDAASGEHKEGIAAATKAAEQWLALVDDGKYGESHDEAAEYFRSAVAREAWEKQIEGVRTPMGKLNSRAVKSTTFATELPGAPDGEYVVILFDASYAGKKSAVETVTPMKEKDGTWKVSGYYIK